jgi:hypothetical protein
MEAKIAVRARIRAKGFDKDRIRSIIGGRRG